MIRATPRPWRHFFFGGTEETLAAFPELDGDKVSVYKIGDFSVELCSGPHVENTKELGKFKIIKEEGISAGVRRIRAVLES